PGAARQPLMQRETGRVGLGVAALVIAACVVGERLLDQGLTPLTASLLGTHRLAGFPPLPPEFRVIDLTVGVLLVAVSEELLCRRAALLVLRNHVRSDAGMIVISAVLFTAMHWTYSPPELINVFLIGCAFMAIYLRIGTLWPLIAAHYVIDLIAFW